MAKKSTQKPRKPRKARLRPFTLHFYLEGGTSVWLEERAESRAVLEGRAKRLLEGPGTWVTLEVHSGTMHVRREKVVGFKVDDLRAAELVPERKSKEDLLHWNEIRLLLDDREIRME